MSKVSEYTARFIVVGLLLALITAVGVSRRLTRVQSIEIHARMPESGGWMPDNLTAMVGEPLHLRLTSDDVMHSFAIGQSDLPVIEVKPGEFTSTTLVFDRPGKYTFYCTRWCGPNHWRMRGTIEVSGEGADPVSQPQPLYLTLGLDIDAEHRAEVIPDQVPSATRGASLNVDIPARYRTKDFYRTHSPAEVWQLLRAMPEVNHISDQEVWDLAAYFWQTNTNKPALLEGEQLFSTNCAACHGETGAGDGVMSGNAWENDWIGNELSTTGAQHDQSSPVDFTDAGNMLGANPALLQGKVIRGGMGTGMPYWGPIFLDDQTWAIVDYLWTFQFQYGD